MRLKDANTRARRNKSPSRAVLPLSHDVEVPELPEGDWHPMTEWWWSDVWTSPMATQYLTADLTGLYVLAHLMDSFWREPSAKTSAEIRLAQRPYGLSPLDRRRLEWTTEQVDSARERRRNKTSPLRVGENH